MSQTIVDQPINIILTKRHSKSSLDYTVLQSWFSQDGCRLASVFSGLPSQLVAVCGSENTLEQALPAGTPHTSKACTISVIHYSYQWKRWTPPASPTTFTANSIPELWTAQPSPEGFRCSLKQLFIANFYSFLLSISILCQKFLPS